MATSKLRETIKSSFGDEMLIDTNSDTNADQGRTFKKENNCSNPSSFSNSQSSRKMRSLGHVNQERVSFSTTEKVSEMIKHYCVSNRMSLTFFMNSIIADFFNHEQ